MSPFEEEGGVRGKHGSMRGQASYSPELKEAGGVWCLVVNREVEWPGWGQSQAVWDVSKTG